jgi:glycosyltransferase involved in cell wall biosynthesis
LLSKKTVVIITNRLVIGGITNDVISLANRLKNDFNITILYGEKEADEIEATHLITNSEDIIFKKIPELRKRINFLYDVKAYRRLSNEIKKASCDIVHTHGSKSGMLGRLAAYKNKVPCIIHTFHGHVFHSYYNAFISGCIIRFERWMARLTTNIIAISKQQGSELIDVYKIVPSDKLSVIYLGVDQQQFDDSNRKSTYTIRERFKLQPGTIAIGMIGRMVAIKNFDLFADVAEKILVSAAGSSIKFFIIGDGELKEKVQQDLSRRNIKWCNAENYFNDAKVIFTSWLSSVNSVLKDLDIVMLTSRNEGTPLSLIEAQYCGKPVIATDAGGVSDTFINNETGFLIAQHNATEFAHKLNLLINDQQLRESMGKKAIEFAAKRFSKSAEVEQLKQLYNNCKSSN